MLYGELKDFRAKALDTGDIGITLIIHAVCNENYPVNMDALKDLLHKPLEINLTESTIEA